MFFTRLLIIINVFLSYLYKYYSKFVYLYSPIRLISTRTGPSISDAQPGTVSIIIIISFHLIINSDSKQRNLIKCFKNM